MPASWAKPLRLLSKPRRTLLRELRNSACTLALATSRPSTGSAAASESVEFIVLFSFPIFRFGSLAAWELALVGFRGHPALETCLYARFFLDRFCAGYDSTSQAGGGTEEPIYSQALALEPRHGLPPPLPQIASPLAAQINLEGKEKIQATALSRRAAQSTLRLDRARRLQHL